MGDVAEPTEDQVQVEQEWRGEDEADRRAQTRITADQQQYQDGFRAGVKIGAAEAEVRAFDGELLDTIETTETLRPEAYDVAVEALQVAVRLVEPIKSATLLRDEEFGPVTSAYARLTTDLADRFYGWLWQFTEQDDPVASGGRGQSLGEPIIDEVLNWPAGEPDNRPRCPVPKCGVLLDSTGACPDPWCPSGGAVVGDPVADPNTASAARCTSCGSSGGHFAGCTVPLDQRGDPVIERVPTPADRQFRPMPEAGVTRCPSCGMSMKYGCSNPQCEAGPEPGELVEDDDGTPLPPEQQPCPECRAGKHDNCGGRVLDGKDQPVACPCAGESHPESLG